MLDYFAYIEALLTPTSLIRSEMPSRAMLRLSNWVFLIYLFAGSHCLIHALSTDRASSSSDDLFKRSNEEVVDSTSESTSAETSRVGGRRAKYPALYKLMIETPVAGNLKYDKHDGALIAKFDKEVLPLDVSEAMKKVSSSSGNIVTKKKDDRYARRKAQAEKEGRLDEFMQAIRDQGARQRAKLKEEDKSCVYRYQHACRKLNVEAIRAKDPGEAERREELRRVQNRESSKRYYLANLEKERARRRKKHTMTQEDANEEELEEVQASTSRAPRDFDLNDSASFDDDDDHGVSEAFEDETPMVRRGQTNEGSSYLPSASRVKYPELLPLVEHIKDQPKGKKLMSHSDMYVDPNTGKLQVEMKDSKQTMQVEAVPSTGNAYKESSYQKRLRKAIEEGPEALEAFRAHCRALCAASKQRKKERGEPIKTTKYYRYLALKSKKEMAELERLDPQMAEERVRFLKERRNITQMKYRQRKKEGLPVKQYHRYDDDYVEATPSTISNESFNDAFDSMALAESSSSDAIDPDELHWNRKGKRTERFLVEDPTEIHWAHKGARKPRDGRNAQWTSEELEAMPEIKDVIEDGEDEDDSDYDESTTKWMSLADSNYSLEEPQPEEEEQESFSQLPFAHIPYDEMTSYQRRLYRAEQKGELDTFRQKKKNWQAAYVNRAIEKEKKLLADADGATYWEGDMSGTQDATEGSESLPVTYYGVRRRRMKDNGTYEEYKKEKARKQRLSTRAQNDVGNAEWSSEAVLALPARAAGRERTRSYEHDAHDDYGI